MGLSKGKERKGKERKGRYVLKKIILNRKAVIQMILLAAGVVMIGVGAQRGEVATVFTKAVRICLECIGIG